MSVRVLRPTMWAARFEDIMTTRKRHSPEQVVAEVGDGLGGLVQRNMTGEDLITELDGPPTRLPQRVALRQRPRTGLYRNDGLGR